MTDRDIGLRTLRTWRDDPVAFVRDNFQVEPDEWQAEALHAIAKPDVSRLAMKACKGPGKTCVLAWIILWFLSTRPNAKVAATSVTGDNLNDNLWPEIAKWLHKSPFLERTFEWSKTRVISRECPDTWFATARTWPKTADAAQQSDALAGLHADHILFVLDESGGIPQAVMTTAEAVLATGIECKVVQAGNPTHLSGPLYRACTTDRHLWHVVTITGDPDNPRRSPRISLEWAKQQIASWSRESPWVMVNVLGEFPPASIDSLLGIEDVEAAMNRHFQADVYEWSQKRLGVDVARYGDDRTVIFPRQGLAAFRPIVMRHARGSSVSTEIASRVMKAKKDWGSELEIFDATGGWAAGAVDVLRAGGVDVLECQFHAPATDPRYANLRAELWFAMAEWVKKGALPRMPELIGELTTPTYTFVKGKFQLEPKDDVKERLGRSPDLADALAMTFRLPEMPASVAQGRQQSAHTAHEFDPYASGNGSGSGRVAHDFDPYEARG